MKTTAAVQSEWFASWFDTRHYQRLYAHRGQREAADLIDRLIDRLRPSDGAAMLDLGCGTGRHARSLAAHGFDVTGLDLSGASIAQAKRHEAPNLRFCRHDMREPFGVDAFDHVFSLFTSFGYFDDPADNLRVVGNVANALRPGGTLVLDYLNAAYAEAHLVPDEVVVRDDVTYRIFRWTDAGHIFKRIEIHEGAGQPIEHTERVARLTFEDFRYMFALCDMQIEASFGDYALGRYEPAASPRLILVARKALADAAEGFRRHAEV